MKPSHIAIGVLLVGGIALLILALWPASEPAPTPQPASTAVAKPKPTTILALPSSLGEPAQSEAIQPTFPSTAETMAGTDKQQQIVTKCQEMMDLAMMDDQASLKKIWKELSNPEKEIRTGAVDAIVQFGDRSKVKALREVAERTEDAEEKLHIIQAADFLTLPPMDLRPGATQVDTPLPPQTPAP